MNLSSKATESPYKWQRIWQEPLTFIVLVWVMMFALASLCIELLD